MFSASAAAGHIFRRLKIEAAPVHGHIHSHPYYITHNMKTYDIMKYVLREKKEKNHAK